MVRKQKDISAAALKLHKKLGGKVGTLSKVQLKTKEDWALLYTPGVGAVSSYLAKHPKEARQFTIKKNTVAVISDGSAVLGLGDIGPVGALPVMEGKALIFKQCADVDAFPIVLNTKDVDEIVRTIKAIAPGFGGVNLEDISAPRCFQIEKRLIEELDVPVMHDDQHGTAIVVLAALINALKVVKKNLKKAHVVIIGAGAAGTGTAMLLLKAGIKDIVLLDRKGILSPSRKDLSVEKKALMLLTNPRKISGTVIDALTDADVVIGLSSGKLIEKHVVAMAKDPIVFALANPIPEIMPDIAKRAGAVVVATGRSDFPNQVNNALVFPGVFRGALDRGVKQITDQMKLNAAKKLADMIKKPTAENIISSVLNKKVAAVVASAIR